MVATLYVYAALFFQATSANTWDLRTMWGNMGVPAKLGSGGIEAIYELDLSKDEQAMLNESAGAVREVVGLLAS